MTYFRMGNPHYHWRGAVSLSCSGWEGVGPARYGRQTKLLPGFWSRDSGKCRSATTTYLIPDS